MEKSINNKKIVVIICACILGISLIGGTVAFYVRELFSTGDQNSITHGLDYYINYTKGRNIEGVTLEPSSSYVGSLASSDIEFWKKDNTYDIYGHIYMDINNLSDTLSNTGALKYSVVYHGNIISEGTITNNSEGTILMAANIPLETSERLFTVYVWLDENLVPGSSINSQSLSLSVRCEATMKAIDYIREGVTPITDFTYYLGSETPVIDLSFTEEGDGEEYDIEVHEMTLAKNEVMLKKYVGASSDVNVPDTYVIDGNIYNVVLVTYLVDDSQCSGFEPHGGTFINNTNIKNVTLGQNIKVILNDSHSCGNADDDDAEGIVENSVSHLFSGCTSLVNVPVIPNSVIDMSRTFSGCTSLVNAPVIPNSVIDMSRTFSGCTSLVNAPEIPDLVVNMQYTFHNCRNLSGNVKINSSELDKIIIWGENVIAIDSIFGGTSKPITVSVPAGSTTYNTFNSNLNTVHVPSNVTLVTH